MVLRLEYVSTKGQRSSGSEKVELRIVGGAPPHRWHNCGSSRLSIGTGNYRQKRPELIANRTFAHFAFSGT
jgi:hypothetical protein